jgi:hypothetical protein
LASCIFCLNIFSFYSMILWMMSSLFSCRSPRSLDSELNVLWSKNRLSLFSEDSIFWSSWWNWLIWGRFSTSYWEEYLFTLYYYFLLAFSQLDNSYSINFWFFLRLFYSWRRNDYEWIIFVDGYWLRFIYLKFRF